MPVPTTPSSVRSGAFTCRERSVAAIAAVMLALAPWGWGGVVFWVVAATFGLGVAVFLAAWGGRRTQLVAAGLWLLWLGVAWFRTERSLHGSDEPGLLPFVPSVYGIANNPWLEALAFPVAALVGQALAFGLLGAERVSAEAWPRLRRCVPFWAGLAFGLYVAVQVGNAYGTVVERDLFWRIVPERPLAWLPSGLRAPLRSDEVDPGAMNGWRLLMILGGPWLLLCAFRAAGLRRRVLVALAWVSVVTAMVFALWGYLNQPTWGEILGFKIPSEAQVYGTFINRNHAGVYLYLNVGLALALGFWHLRRAGEVAVRGGPHLLAAFAAVMLAFFTLLTNSVGGVLVVGGLLGVVAPLALWFGMSQEHGAVRRGAWATAAAILASGFIFAAVADFGKFADKIRGKAESYRVTGSDDRAPLRAATWRMAMDKPWTGWGAGSYRWVSPVYQVEEKALQDARGRLRVRALYAHNDWLQLLAEVGWCGLIPLFAVLGWVGRRAIAAGEGGHPEALPLAGLLLLFACHAGFDLLCWFTPLLCVLALVVASLAAFTEQSSSALNRRNR
jgi:O-antigen ligase